MRSVLVVLAVLCLLIGLNPSLAIQALGQVTADLSTAPGAGPSAPPVEIQAFGLWIQVPVEAPGGGKPVEYSTGLTAWMLMAAAGMVFVPGIVVGLRHARRRLPTSPAFVGGEAYPPEAIQVSGTAYASLVWAGFEQQGPLPAAAGPPEALPQVIPLAGGRWMTESFRGLYSQALRRAADLSARLGDRIQGGDIRSYLTYIFFVLLAVLGIAVWVILANGEA
jgi:hypothetical protein